MKCEHVANLLQEHAERLLLPIDRAAVDGHLGRCDRCATEAARVAVLVRALSDLPDPHVPGAFVDSVMGALPEMLPARHGTGHVLRWGLAAAAAVFAFLAGLTILLDAGGPAVARDTLEPLAASLHLGGMLLAHVAAAAAGALDAFASLLATADIGAKLTFALFFSVINGALFVAVVRYRHAFLGGDVVRENGWH